MVNKSLDCKRAFLQSFLRSYGAAVTEQSDLDTHFLQGQCTNHKEWHFTEKLNWLLRARLLASSSQWRSKKILSLPPLMDTKTITTYGTAISGNNLKTSRTDFYNYAYKKVTLKWVGRVETKSSQDLYYPPPHSPCSDSQVGGISQLQSSPLKSEVSNL